ncbi:MAG: hypothetical protein HC803_02945 [Saprospiraceae bacterium]|nr:hypothetical protein [Saprospiraceae bacterium]
MKRNYSTTFLLLFFLLITTSSNAQIRGLSVGFGGSLNHFQRSENDPYLQHFSQVLPHFHLKLETSDLNGFIGQVQTNFYMKQIRLGYRYKNAAGGTNTEGFHHDYISSDVVISAAHNYRINGLTRLRPRLGFFVSFNQHIGTTDYSGVSGGGSNNSSQAMYYFDIETSDSPFFIYPGIFLGFSTLRYVGNRNRGYSLFADLYLAPRNIFSNPFEYTINGSSMELQGKYHYLNMGLRVDLYQ